MLQIANLLSACPKLNVLVTSREVLHVRAEHEYAVSPFAVPNPKRLPDLATLAQYASVVLFIARAQAVNSEATSCGSYGCRTTRSSRGVGRARASSSASRSIWST